MENSLNIKLSGQDSVQINLVNNKHQVTFKGCHEFTEIMLSFKRNFGVDIARWPLPKGNSHSEMLIRELILKLQGKWQFPYVDQELCHCRHVSTSIVDEAIINGAHTSELASLWTGCSTACGTCRADVETIIKYRTDSGF